jgi:hypothetical protein
MKKLTTILVGALALAATPALAASSDGNAGAAIMIILITLAGYFFPTGVAAARGHHQTLAIFLLNLLLGWTGLGWIAALIWAATAIPKENNV